MREEPGRGAAMADELRAGISDGSCGGGGGWNRGDGIREGIRRGGGLGGGIGREESGHLGIESEGGR